MAPSRRLAVIIVGNRTGASLPKLAKAISEAMLPLEPEQPALPAPHSISAEELRRYAGVYVNGNCRIVLRESNGALTGGTGEARLRFTHARNGFLLEEPAGARRLRD